MPDGVDTIGGSAFYGCSALQSITLPDGVKTIGDSAFSGYYALQSITLPDSALSLGRRLGVFPLRLTPTEGPRLRLLDGVLFTADGKTLLRCPIDKTGVYVVPDGVETIDDGAFAHCDSLTSVKLPDSLRAVGQNALPPKLIDDANAAKYCRVIDDVQFSLDGKTLLRCPVGKSGPYLVPRETETIAENAFAGCRRLTALTLLDGLKTLEPRSLVGCSSLQMLTIPKSVESVGRDALPSDELRAVVFLGAPELAPQAPTQNHCYIASPNGEINNGNSPTLTTKDFNERRDAGLLLDASGQTVLACLEDQRRIVVPNGVERIAAEVFTQCRQLTTITLPDSLQTIERRAFAGCRSLRSVNFGDGLQTIGAEAFGHCSSLTSIEFPSGLQTIGVRAFFNCQTLRAAVFGDGLQSIGDGAFFFCSNSLTFSAPKNSVAEKFARAKRPVLRVVTSRRQRAALLQDVAPTDNRQPPRGAGLKR